MRIIASVAICSLLVLLINPAYAQSASPSGLASFVEPGVDPQYYVDRYNNEESYRQWFDDNFPQYSSIHQAVGLEDPAAPVPQQSESDFGECGIGTRLIGDTCQIIAQPKETKTEPPKRGCLIATAAYGSELAPQVQLLREVRDGTLMSTESGAAFMAGFNTIYYSFSPAVADLEREHPVFREAVRLLITPMLSTLSVMTLAESGSESHVLGLGISVILLNLGMYIAAPVVGLKAAGRLSRAARNNNMLRAGQS